MTNYHSRAFGELVHGVRTRRRITASALAEQIHVDRATVRRLELGETQMTLERASAIADALRLPLEQMIQRADTKAREARRADQQAARGAERAAR